VTVAFGWKNAFLALAGAAFLTALVALVLVAHQRLHRPRSAEA
jgi:predicted MFS family arabinose efflux permease